MYDIVYDDWCDEMTYTKARRKQPKTFSLSEDVVEVLESYKREKKVESLSSAFEEIVRDWKKTHLESLVTSYYDSISDEEVKGQKKWGEFSESEM